MKDLKTPYFVYILRTSANTLYIGQTNNLLKRVEEHKSKSSKSAKYIRYFDSCELVYFEKFQSRGDAMRREIELKKLTRVKKDTLIKAFSSDILSSMINTKQLSEKQKSVFEQVEKLYNQSKLRMAHWIWRTHVQVVANNTLALAKKYNANKDYVFCGALLHDLGDVWLDRDHPQFESVGKSEAEKILRVAGFSNTEIATILTEIIEPHSCNPNHYPTILEGKILATADAITHFKTNFYNEVKEIAFPNITTEEYRQWVNKKLDKDLKIKILFNDIRAEVEPFYKKWKEQFQ